MSAIKNIKKVGIPSKNKYIPSKKHNIPSFFLTNYVIGCIILIKTKEINAWKIIK